MNLESRARSDDVEQAIVMRLTLLSALSFHQHGVPKDELRRSLAGNAASAELDAGLARLAQRGAIYADANGYRVRSIAPSSGRTLRAPDRFR